VSTLKELTADLHAEAEAQPFLKTIFEGNVDRQKYTSYLFQLLNIYGLLETLARPHGLFKGMEGLERTKEIEKDWKELCGYEPAMNMLNNSTVVYLNHLIQDDVKNDPKKLMAHIYVRHMGDLFGGQQLAKLLPGSNHMYKFEDIPTLVNEIRSKIDVSLADEARVAFKHNIEMLKDYN
jgi:heme oxygenase